MTNISIILTAYNDEKNVRQCLESIIAQENTDMQMECIIVDDCSTDNTLALIRRVAGSYKGNISFRIFRHQSHHGVSRSRNTGFARAHGDYVMFMNATDLLRPGCMDTFMVSLMRYWDADVLVGNVFNVSTRRVLFDNIASPMALRGRGDVICHEMLRSHLNLSACNKLVRRELLLSSHIIFNESIDFADIQWANALFADVTSIALLPEITYDLWPRPTSGIASAMKWAAALLDSYAATCEYMLSKTPRPEGSDSDYYQLHQLFIEGVLSHADELLAEYNVGSQMKRDLSNIRSRLLSQTRNDGQKTLYLFLKQRNSLFNTIFKLPIFRTYNALVQEVVTMLGDIAGNGTPADQNEQQPETDYRR